MAISKTHRMTYILFFVGFYILIKAANWLVDGAVWIANHFKIPSMIIGLIIVGIGTSIPEFSITFLANLLESKSDIALGTILGSNTFNILFILGLAAIIRPISFRKEWIEEDLWWNIFAVSLFALLVFFSIANMETIIGRVDGLLLLVAFAAWLFYALYFASNEGDKEENATRIFTFPLAAGMIIAGLIGVLLGAKWVIDGAAAFAVLLGMSEAFVGLTIISIGTSLPELVVSVAAAYRGEMGIAVGNIIGSNIFDFLMIIGLSATVHPIIFEQALYRDTITTLFATLMLLFFMYVGTRNTLTRKKGILFIAAYCLYVLVLFARG